MYESEYPKVKSFAALAVAIGVSAPTVGAWAKRPDWPFRTPYDIDEVRAWRAANVGPTTHAGQTRGGGDSLEAIANSPLKQAQLERTIEQARRLRLENEQVEGELLRRDKVEREWTHRVLTVRAALEQLVRDVPNNVEGATAVQRRAIEAAVRSGVEQVCALFSGEAKTGTR